MLGLGAWNIELEVTGQVVGSLVCAWSSLEHPEEAERLIGDIFDVSHPQALHAAIDNLFRGDQAALERLGPVVAERLRNRLEQRGTPADAYIAAISAEGLVRLAINGAWSRLQVAAVMASVSDSEEPLFATSAARLIAVLYDHLPEPELVAALHRLAAWRMPPATPRTPWGLVYLRDGLGSALPDAARQGIQEAVGWFERAARADEDRSDAHAWVAGLAEWSASFADGAHHDLLDEQVEELREVVARRSRWLTGMHHTPSTPEPRTQVCVAAIGVRL